MSIENLTAAIQSLNADDALHVRYSPDEWRLMGSYMQRHVLRPGDTVIRFRDMDRSIYLIESGTLQVYVPESAPVRRPVAILRPGSVVGEPALFGDTPRMAQVEAMSASVVWGMPRHRFDEFAARQPELALELLRAVGAVMAVRMRANLDRGLPVA
jgi:CRP-like cAMP-binding protein